MLAWLRGTRLTPILVVHANHPQEIDDSVSQRPWADWSMPGIPVLNQAVLLRGVNDDAETLAELCRRLLDCRVHAVLPAPVGPRGRGRSFRGARSTGCS